MTYVLAGYGVTLAGIVGYAAWVLHRGRSLTKGRDQ